MKETLETIEGYCQYVNALERKRLVLLGKFFDREARLYGPNYNVEGVEQIRHAIEVLFSRIGDFKVKVISAVLDEEQSIALLRWDILYYKKGKAETVSGCSELMFNRKGLIVAQTDYWDTGKAILSKAPLLGGMNKSLLKKSGLY